MSQTQPATQTPTDALNEKLWVDTYIKTFHETMRNCLPHEFPDWVVKINDAIQSGDTNELRFDFGGKLLKVYAEVKATFSISKSDSIC
jgi:hypothetical protein